MCEICEDVKREIGWVQLTLDASYELRYRGVECQCRYELIEVVLVATSDVNGR